MPDSIIKADNISSLSGGGVGFPDGSISNPSMKFTNDGDTGLYRIGANTIGISSNGSRVGEIGPGYGGFTGNIIQVAYNELTTSGVVSSPWIPGDDTIPQNTEGAEILTCSITPRYSNSILYVESLSFVGENTNVLDVIAATLFRDNEVNAIATSFHSAPTHSGAPWGSFNFNPIYLMGRVTSGSTNSTIFRLRSSATYAGTGTSTIRWNGANGARFYGGTLVTYIRVIEVQV